MGRFTRWLAKQDARDRLAIALVAAALAWLALRHRTGLPVQYIATWDVFAACVLGLAWLTILFTPQKDIRARARDQDAGRTVVFIFAIVAACAGLSAVGFLFYTNKHAQEQPHLASHLLLSVLAVIASWSLVHTVFTLRYAHAYYGDHDQNRKEHAGGLEFPSDSRPDYLDFAYFAFVIGMTFQVSDVEISSKRLRRLALIHGTLSFGFNTVILALTINTLSSLL